MDSEYLLHPALYSLVYYNFMFLIVVITSLQIVSKWNIIQDSNRVNLYTTIVFVIITLYIGLRPISGVFVDMMTYNRQFERMVNGAQVGNSDILWSSYVKLSSMFISAELFFLNTAFLYIYPLYKASKKLVKHNSFILFLALIISFSFWAYGTNGLRNGVATSIFVLGISYHDNRKLSLIILFISYLVHGAMIIPIAAYILPIFVRNPKYYFLGWLAAIPLSLVMGGFWENFFMSFDVGGERSSYMSGVDDASKFSSTGFRWDFLIYSSSAVYAGYYFVLKRGLHDKVYNHILNTFLTANAFWILVIRANYSNRFAYLSWFLMAIVIFYPFLKQYFFKDQSNRLAIVLVLYFSFTYYMNI